MKASDELFNLIKSLTKTEKRYFTLFASLQKGSKTFIKLFNAIDEQTRSGKEGKEYDEGSIKKKFQGEKFIKQLTFTKIYLTNLILKSLRNFHSSNSAINKANHLLLNIGILYNKELLDLCLKQITTLKKITEKHELYVQYFEALSWEENVMNKQQFITQDINAVEKMISEKNNVLAKVNNINHYNSLVTRWWYSSHKKITNRDASDRAYYQAIEIDSLLKNKQQAITRKSKLAFYLLKSFLHKRNGNMNQTIAYRTKLLDYMEQFTDNIITWPKMYIAAIFNLAGDFFDMGKHKQALSILKKSDRLKKIKLDDAARRFLYEANINFKTDFYNNTGEFDKTISLISEFESGINEFKQYDNSSLYFIAVHNIACAYMGVTDFKNALKWINKILNSKVPVVEDIHCFARIINLVIHFEMGNEEHLEYITRSTYRYLYKRKRLYKVESCIIDFMRKTERLNSQKEFMSAFKKLQEELIRLSSDPFESRAFEYFDFISWLESKIENRPFAEIVKQKARMNDTRPNDSSVGREVGQAKT